MRRIKLLLVDDEEELLRAMRIRLVGWGYDVLTATDGKEAIQLVKKEVADAIILDIMMPDMSGIELAERFSKGESSLRPPFVLLTPTQSKR